MCAPIHSLIRPFSHQTALVSLPSPVASWTILRAERVQHNPILKKLTVKRGAVVEKVGWEWELRGWTMSLQRG